MDASVIIPSYNRAYLLSRALESVWLQSLKPKEVILVDDGSEDKTEQLALQYACKFKQKKISFHYIKQKNQGVSAARNNGIKCATTQWLAFLDSDDAWQPAKLQQQLQQLAKNESYKICHTNELWFRQGKQINPMKKHEKKGGSIYQYCLPFCRISPSSVMIHKDLFNEIGLFDESLPACEDYDLWLRITAHYEVLYINEALTIKYGGHEDQLSKKHWGMDRFRIQALEKILKTNCLNSLDEAATKKELAKKLKIFIEGAKKHNNLNYLRNFTQANLQRSNINE